MKEEKKEEVKKIENEKDYQITLKGSEILYILMVLNQQPRFQVQPIFEKIGKQLNS